MASGNFCTQFADAFSTRRSNRPTRQVSDAKVSARVCARLASRHVGCQSVQAPHRPQAPSAARNDWWFSEPARQDRPQGKKAPRGLPWNPTQNLLQMLAYVSDCGSLILSFVFRLMIRKLCGSRLLEPNTDHQPCVTGLCNIQPTYCCNSRFHNGPGQPPSTAAVLLRQWVVVFPPLHTKKEGAH